MSNHARRHHRPRRSHYPKVIAATYVTEEDELVRMLLECRCPRVIDTIDGLSIVRQLHEHLCPVLRRVKAEKGRRR